MDLGLQEKVVLITGASGGIGRALAAGFYAEGASLALLAHSNRTDLEKHAGELWSADRYIILSADMARPAEIQTAVNASVTRFGRLDSCIINAGVWPAESAALHELAEERLRSTLEINLLGAIWTTRAFMTSIAATGPRANNDGANITLISSTAARFGEKHHVDYSVSKAGFYGLVRSLKNELPALDPYARINIVEPGWTATPMAKESMATPGLLASVVRTMPLQQIARAVDIANAVLFLSSPLAARHITGEVITVAGGMEGRLLYSSDEIDEDKIRGRLV